MLQAGCNNSCTQLFLQTVSEIFHEKVQKQEVREKMKKSLTAENLWFSSIAAAVILGIIGISYIRQNPESFFPAEQCGFTVKDAIEWYNAVESGKETKAILYAAKIVPDDIPSLPDPDYMQLLLNNGLGTLILTSPFNHFDYLRWKDALEINKIVQSYSGNNELIPLLFKAVLARKNADADEKSMSFPEIFKKNADKLNDKPYVSVIDIWNKGYTSLDELIRLLSAVAYQAGYKVQIIALIDKQWPPKHVVCEFRKNGKSYVADPVYGKIWKDTSVAEFAENPDLLKDVWPENIINLSERCIYMLPAETMDFKAYNRQLYTELKKSKVPFLPLFGENPQSRIDVYIQKYADKVEKRYFSYWNFPFHSLMSSLTFPQDWKLTPLKRNEAEKSNYTEGGN